MSMLLEKTGFSEVRARSYFFPSLGRRMGGMNEIASAPALRGDAISRGEKSEGVRV